MVKLQVFPSEMPEAPSHRVNRLLRGTGVGRETIDELILADGRIRSLVVLRCTPFAHARGTETTKFISACQRKA